MLTREEINIFRKNNKRYIEGLNLEPALNLAIAFIDLKEFIEGLEPLEETFYTYPYEELENGGCGRQIKTPHRHKENIAKNELLKLIKAHLKELP
jgi:hypothetical protein